MFIDDLLLSHYKLKNEKFVYLLDKDKMINTKDTGLCNFLNIGSLLRLYFKTERNCIMIHINDWQNNKKLYKKINYFKQRFKGL